MNSGVDFIWALLNAIFWIVMLILWLNFMSDVKERLRALEKIATRQTELLDAIALNTLTAEQKAEVVAARAAAAAKAEQDREARQRALEQSSRRENLVFGAVMIIATLAAFGLYLANK